MISQIIKTINITFNLLDLICVNQEMTTLNTKNLDRFICRQIKINIKITIKLFIIIILRLLFNIKIYLKVKHILLHPAMSNALRILMLTLVHLHNYHTFKMLKDFLYQIKVICLLKICLRIKRESTQSEKYWNCKTLSKHIKRMEAKRMILFKILKR